MASLNHANIVRYYDSWFDTWAPDSSQNDITRPPVGNSFSISSSIATHISSSAASSSVPTADSGATSTTASLPHPSNPPDNVTYLYIRMELCRTDTLRDWLDQHRENRPTEECVKIFQSVVSAVDYLHQQNFMHRDIKVSVAQRFTTSLLAGVKAGRVPVCRVAGKTV